MQLNLSVDANGLGDISVCDIWRGQRESHYLRLLIFKSPPLGKPGYPVKRGLELQGADLQLIEQVEFHSLGCFTKTE